MKTAFLNKEGGGIVYAMIAVIQENKQYLSDIDGAIGDGDHGINMNKGFSMCKEQLAKQPGGLSHSLQTLADVLVLEIGGSMGPLYGMLFEAMAETAAEEEEIDAALFLRMLEAGVDNVLEIGGAKVGDKTLLDVLVPALEAFRQSQEAENSFETSLTKLKEAAVQGRDATKDMVAKVGRASRLGERSRGVLDAGATSCCLLLCAMADSIRDLL